MAKKFTSKIGLQPIYSTKDPDGNPATLGEAGCQIMRDNLEIIEEIFEGKAEETDADGNKVVRSPDGKILSSEKGQDRTKAPDLKLFTEETNNINASLLEKIKVVRNGDTIIKDGQYLMADNGTVNLETGVTSETFDTSLLINANATSYDTGALVTSSVSHCSNLLPIGNIIRIHSNQVGTATTAAAIAFYDSNSNYLKDISVSIADAKIKDGIPDSRVAYYRVARSTTDDIILYKKSIVTGQIANQDAITLITVTGGAYTTAKLHDIPYSNLMYGTPDTIPKKGYNYFVNTGLYNNFRVIEPQVFDTSLLVNANATSYDTGALVTSSVSHSSNLLPIGDIVRIHSNQIGTATGAAAIAFYDLNSNYLKETAAVFGRESKRA